MPRLRHLLGLFFLAGGLVAQAGYYRQPTLHGDELVFVAEGDLWRVDIEGGRAARLTTHPDRESDPAISPDGRWLAFKGNYEGVAEVYLMPLDGGRPRRLTTGATALRVDRFTEDGRLLYSTSRHSGLPALQLMRLDVKSGATERVPLEQAWQGAFFGDDQLIFTRFRHNQHCKRYEGGRAEQLWRFDGASGADAVKLFADHAGTSRHPMVWKDRLYFVSDRDGTLNLWSSTLKGTELVQLTHHVGWDVMEASLSEGRIAYRLGADIRVLDVAEGGDRLVPITLGSDFDQSRERWHENPMSKLGSGVLSPKGDRVLLIARGQAFVAWTKDERARVIPLDRKAGTRWREGAWLGKGDRVVGFSDESDEVELWSVAADGSPGRTQHTKGARVLRWGVSPSPDGKFIAFHDKDNRLHRLEVASGESVEIDRGEGRFRNLRWSKDSRWLAYVRASEQGLGVIKMHDVASGASLEVTSARFSSASPAFSPDGKWLFFVSKRDFSSKVSGPWGAYQPEPYFDATDGLYAVALTEDHHFPFVPTLEAEKAKEEKGNEAAKIGKVKKKGEKAKEGDASNDGVAKKKEKKEVVPFPSRTFGLYRLPQPSGRYGSLALTKKALFFTARGRGEKGDRSDLLALSLEPGAKAKTVLEKASGFQMSADGKRMLVRRGGGLHVVPVRAGAIDPKTLGKGKVDLSSWRLRFDPREDWRQIFADAWRLHRDYFYDPGMHGVDWPAMRRKYEPLVGRVSDRDELNDLVGQMIAELSALHSRASGGDRRDGPDDVSPASFGARIVADAAAEAWRIEHIHRGDPARPERRSPLARPDLRLSAGDLITAIDGRPFTPGQVLEETLRDKGGKRVRLAFRRRDGKSLEAEIAPISARQARNLRYDEWEWSRRRRVEELGGGRLGYIHLRSMVRSDIGDWVREYSSQFDRQGLIVDVRGNGGGNIDSWILSRLSRKAWFYWQGRGRKPYWNMQKAFRGHMTCLANQATGSDGEAFAEGFRRLGLGKVIGTRTWGGEIWLSRGNRLVDRGVASAGEYGVYDAEGRWLIEGHGVVPDIEIDNPPHATFKGEDAQLDRAIRHLLDLIEKDPRPVPPVPPFPDKASADNRGAAGVAAGNPAPKVQRISSFDGTEIECEVRGQGQTALVFVHGWSCDRSFWKHQVEAFASKYRVVTLDQAGHGASRSTRRKEWTLDALARDLALVVDSLGLQRVILVGHSMGGPVSLLAAPRLEGRLLGIVGVDTLHDVGFRFTQEMADAFAARFRKDWDGGMSASIAAMVDASTEKAVVDWITTRATEQDRELMPKLIQVFNGFDPAAALAAAKVPVRCLNSRARPPVIPPTATERNARHGDFKAEILDNVGHYPMLEKPARFNRRLAKVVEALSASR